MRVSLINSRGFMKSIVSVADGRAVSGASVYVSLTEDGDMSSQSGTVTDEAGRFTRKIFAGLQYKISAYRRGQGDKYFQTEYVDLPQVLDGELRLVLPALPRN